MKYNELNVDKNKNAKRVGRGIAAGRGKTAGRGTKGQNARKSGGVRPGFEGGQNPLYKRIPKLRGFKSVRPETEEVYTSQLAQVGAKVDNKTLFEAGLVKSAYSSVKVILNGDLDKKVEVKLQRASKGAVKMIEKAGGTFEAVERPKMPTAKKAEK